MALQSSGQISLNDIHIEAGGSTGTQCSFNDTDIRALISSTSNTEVDAADFYGASGALTITLPMSDYVYTSKSNSSRAMFKTTGLTTAEFTALTGAFPGPNYVRGVNGSDLHFSVSWNNDAIGGANKVRLLSRAATAASYTYDSSQMTTNGVSFTSMYLKQNGTLRDSYSVGDWNWATTNSKMEIPSGGFDLNPGTWTLEITI